MSFRSLVACALTASLALHPFVAHAQSKVGTAIVDGERVYLYSDNTWAVSTRDENASCVLIDDGVEFCGANDGWVQLNSPDPEVDALFRVNDKNYGMVVTEKIGASSGLTAKYMRSTAIANFASGAGLRPEDVPVLDTGMGKLGDLETEMVSYYGKIDGLHVVFRNTILIEENRTTQLVTYSVDKILTEDHIALHDDYLALFELN